MRSLLLSRRRKRVWWVRLTQEGRNRGKLNNYKIIIRLKIYWINRNWTFTSNTNLQKVDFLSVGQNKWPLPLFPIVNKLVMQSWLNEILTTPIFYCISYVYSVLAIVNVYFQSFSHDGKVYSPHFRSNSSFNIYSPWTFSVMTQGSALEFGHVYRSDSVIFFGHLD